MIEKINDFFIPIVYGIKSNRFPRIVNFAENYLYFGTHCYKSSQMKTDGTTAVIENQFPKDHCHYIALKIASMILSLGVFPLAMLIIKFLYRFYHPLSIHLPKKILSPTPIEQDSEFSNIISSLEKQPKEILKKTFTYLTPHSNIPQYAILNKRFNKIVNHDLFNWKEFYTKATEDMQQSEMDAFIKRVKMLYTKGQEPSSKQKVQYLCEEMWEDAKQIPGEVSAIIHHKKIGDLLNFSFYRHLKKLIQPIKDINLVVMAKALVGGGGQTNFPSLKNVINDSTFLKETTQQQALIIREWFALNALKNQLPTNATHLKLLSKPLYYWPPPLAMVSTEMLSFMQMLNLVSLKVDIHLRILPKAIGMLSQLQELDLVGCQLDSIPHTIGNLSQLQKLK